MIALFANQEKHAPEFLRLRLQQIDCRADRVQNCRPAIARLKVFQRVLHVLARMRVIEQEMRFRVESHQRGLALLVGEKQIEQRTKLGDLAKFQGTHASLLNRHDQCHRRRVHLLLHTNLLRYPIVLEHKIRFLEPIEDAATLLPHEGGNEDFVRGYAEVGSGFARAGYGLGRFRRRQLLGTGQAGTCKQWEEKPKKTSKNWSAGMPRTSLNQACRATFNRRSTQFTHA